MRENNILIAEFMNWSIEEWEGKNRLGDDDSDTFYIYDEEGNEFDEEDLLFHESWDLLMPVVEKILDLKTNERLTNNITKRLVKCDLISTYSNVIEFIKQQKP